MYLSLAQAADGYRCLPETDAVRTKVAVRFGQSIQQNLHRMCTCIYPDYLSLIPHRSYMLFAMARGPSAPDVHLPLENRASREPQSCEWTALHAEDAEDAA